MEIFLTIRADSTLLALAAKLIDLGQQIIKKEDQTMSTLQDVIDATAAETTAIGAMAIFIQGLQAQVAALPGITPEIQAQIDGIFSNLAKNKEAITAAMLINVPPAPPPTVVPPIIP